MALGHVAHPTAVDVHRTSAGSRVRHVVAIFTPLEARVAVRVGFAGQILGVAQVLCSMGVREYFPHFIRLESFIHQLMDRCQFSEKVEAVKIEEAPPLTCVIGRLKSYHHLRRQRWIRAVFLALAGNSIETKLSIGSVEFGENLVSVPYLGGRYCTTESGTSARTSRIVSRMTCPSLNPVPSNIEVVGSLIHFTHQSTK